eukprot:COSAG02_NODE_1061_length_14864_cov_7.878090_5_plen_38_part_00
MCEYVARESTHGETQAACGGFCTCVTVLVVGVLGGLL